MGHLLLQLFKEMILSWKKNTRSLENIKYNRPSAMRGLETRLFQGFFCQNLAVRPYLEFSGFGGWPNFGNGQNKPKMNRRQFFL